MIERCPSSPTTYASNREVLLYLLAFNILATLSESSRIIELPFIFSDTAYCLDTLLLQRTSTGDQISTPEIRDRNNMQAPTDGSLVSSLTDVTIATIERDGQYVHHSFYYLSPLDDQVWFGTLRKDSDNNRLTIEEINRNLHSIDSSRVYPQKPASFKVAPASAENVWIKRPDFDSLDSLGTHWVTNGILQEASIMESLPPHPNIVTYYGCRAFHGRITGIVLERLPVTLMNAKLDDIDIPTFLAALQSAIDHLHSLGLAHNDINPYNIMIKGGNPILIDFGACAPQGESIQSGGTSGWCEDVTFFSDTRHDAYAMMKLREWFQNGGRLKDEN